MDMRSIIRINSKYFIFDDLGYSGEEWKNRHKSSNIYYIINCTNAFNICLILVNSARVPKGDKIIQMGLSWTNNNRIKDKRNKEENACMSHATPCTHTSHAKVALPSHTLAANPLVGDTLAVLVVLPSTLAVSSPSSTHTHGHA